MKITSCSFVDRTTSAYLKQDKLKPIAHGLFKCLKQFHSRNILHRDLKPQNVLIRQLQTQQQGGQQQELTFNVKFCDLGFATQVPDKGLMTQYVGTRWYRSPQLLTGQSYGKPNDVWAIGCILAQLLTGKTLFPGKTQISQLKMIQQYIGQLTPLQKRYVEKNPKFIGAVYQQFQDRKILKLKLQQRTKNEFLIDLIMKCLQIDQRDRITAEQAIKHPFIHYLYLLQEQNNKKKEQAQKTRLQKQELARKLQKIKKTKSARQLTIFKRRMVKSPQKQQLQQKKKTKHVNYQLYLNPLEKRLKSAHESFSLNKSSPKIRVRLVQAKSEQKGMFPRYKSQYDLAMIKNSNSPLKKNLLTLEYSSLKVYNRIIDTYQGNLKIIGEKQSPIRLNSGRT